MRRIIMTALIAVSLTGILAGSATALKSGGTGSIALKSDSQLRLGGMVGFTTNAAGLAGWQYPMVAVWCYQSTTLVYMDLQKPSYEFKLGADSSLWVRNGGPASCTAYLYAYGWRHGQESIQTLASTSFDAAG